jgi:hypothetical protein
MSVPVWCADLAADFWARAGSPPPFPRDLRGTIPYAVPMSVIELPGVSVTVVREWFARLSVPVPLNEPDRPLRACLVAWLGQGFAFVDSDDSWDEQAFSVAHELAHFLRDYLAPRETVLNRLGPEALDVLDGRRPPTPTERFQSVLRNVPVGPFTHLMRRDGAGRPATNAEREAELAADRLAYELLAPFDSLGELRDRVSLTRRLAHEFGLPAEPASRYASILLPESREVGMTLSRFLVR